MSNNDLSNKADKTALDNKLNASGATAGNGVSLSVGTPYTTTSDGYLTMYGGNSTSARTQVAVKAGNTSVVTVSAIGHATLPQYNGVYVKKGATLDVQYIGSNGVALFYPFSYS